MVDALMKTPPRMDHHVILDPAAIAAAQFGAGAVVLLALAVLVLAAAVFRRSTH